MFKKYCYGRELRVFADACKKLGYAKYRKEKLAGKPAKR